MAASGDGPVKLQTSHSANALQTPSLRMMKAERLSGARATRATPGDAEVMGKVGSAPLWPRISRRRAGRRRTDPTLEGRRKPLSFMKRECTVGWAVALIGFLAGHFLLAHFVVVAPSLEKTCSSLHCAGIVVLRFLSLYSVPIL